MESQLLLDVDKLKQSFLAMPNAKALADIFLSIENNRNTLFLLQEQIIFKAIGDCTSDQLKQIEQIEQIEQRKRDLHQEIVLLADALTELDAMLAFWTGNNQETTMPTEVDSVRCHSEISALLKLKHQEYDSFLQSVGGEFWTPPDNQTVQRVQTLQQRFWAGLNAIQSQIAKLRKGKGKKHAHANR